MKRNHVLDACKGLAALNIIFIHTVCWSGNLYIPSYVRTLALILDVPFFFFLSGWGYAISVGSSKRSANCTGLIGITLSAGQDLAQGLGREDCEVRRGYCSSSWRGGGYKRVGKSVFHIYKRYVYFTVLYYVIWSVCNLSMHFSEWSVRSVTKNLFLNFLFCGQSLPYLDVLIPSMWFMPVYIIVLLLISYLLSLDLKKDSSIGNLNVKKLFAVMSFLLLFFWNKDLFLKSIFYGLFFLIGYISSEWNAITTKYYLLILSSIVVILLGCRYLFSVNIYIMEDLKFPPTFSYLAYSMISVVTALYIKSVNIKENFILAKIGKNALLFYFSQGISSSFIIYIADYMLSAWPYKMVMCFAVNLISCIMVVIMLKLFFYIVD